MRKRFDHLVVGLVIGLIAPLLTLYTFYLFTYRSQTSFNGFIQYFSRFNHLVSSVSLCVIINLLIFFLFIWTNNLRSARGVVFATLTYGVWVVYQKFLA